MWPASVVYLLLGTIISRGTNALPNTAVEVPSLADAIHKIENTTTELKSLLSSRASVKLLSQSATASRTRWSSFDAPQPKYVVKVQNEQDVANVVSNILPSPYDHSPKGKYVVVPQSVQLSFEGSSERASQQMFH